MVQRYPTLHRLNFIHLQSMNILKNTFEWYTRYPTLHRLNFIHLQSKNTHRWKYIPINVFLLSASLHSYKNKTEILSDDALVWTAVLIDRLICFLELSVNWIVGWMRYDKYLTIIDIMRYLNQDQNISRL